MRGTYRSEERRARKWQKKFENDILLKTPKNNGFFWLSEPEPYPENVRFLYCLRKELVDLLREDKELYQAEELFSGLTIRKELHDRGILFWGDIEEVKRKEELWSRKALREYDKLLAGFIKHGEHKETVDKLRKRIFFFCRGYGADEEFKKKVILRELVVTEEEKLARAIRLSSISYYNNDEGALRNDVEEFRKELEK